MVSRIDHTLTSPFRAVRAIVAAEGPWPGMLTCLPSGERRLFVDAAALGPDWGGWDAAIGGHVLGAIDVARRQGGHDVLLAVCPERLETFVLRRQASARPLTPGEAVTIGVSVLRGSGELAGRRDGSGCWWLDETGKPVFATGAAGPTLLEGALALLDTLARAAPHPTAWTDAASALSAVRLSAAELDRAEQELFGVADPVALDLSVASARAVGAPPGRMASDPAAEEPRRPLWESLARHVDADVADLVSRVTTSLWRRARAEPKKRRRTPLIVAAGAAAAVLSVGLMWPAGADGGALSEDGTPTITQTPSAPGVPDGATAPAHTPDGATATAADEAEGAESDLAAITRDLLHRWESCDDDDCRAGFTMSGSATVQDVDVPPERRAIVLLDDFGGVAVLRVDDEAATRPSQLIVIAQQDGEWLLRDIHDAAQQP